MAEFLEESTGLESTTVGIYRTAATVKGGRRFSFSALVVVGDRRGSVGLGYAKAPGVPAAIEKAQKAAKKGMTRVTLQEGTIPHEITSEFCSSKVRLLPASPGTGVIAGATVRAVLEMAGVRDCLTKSMGSTNQKNLAKAVLAGLRGLRSKQRVQELRGIPLGETEVDERLEAGRRYAPVSTVDRPRAPVAKRESQKPKRGGRGGGRGRGRGRSRSGPRERAAAGKPAGPVEAQRGAGPQERTSPAPSGQTPPSPASPPPAPGAEGGGGAPGSEQ